MVLQFYLKSSQRTVAGASCFNNFQHKANSIKENYFYHDFSMITESIEGERAVFDLPPKVVDVGRKADW